MQSTTTKVSMLDQRDIDRLEELDKERVEAYMKTTLGPPQAANVPEGWNILVELDALPDGREYAVEYLRGGIALGHGWQPLRETYEHDLVARAKAFERTKESGQPTRIVASFSPPSRPGKAYPASRILTVCVFYERDEKVFIAMRVGDVLIEQEVRHASDGAGGEIRVVKYDGETNLGPQDSLKGLEHSA